MRTAAGFKFTDEMPFKTPSKPHRILKNEGLRKSEKVPLSPTLPLSAPFSSRDTISFKYFLKELQHRLKMELDIHSLFELHVHCAQLYSLAETPQPPRPPLAFGVIYEGAIGQPR